MGDPEFLETLGLMIVLSAVLLVVARRLSVPSIVLFILAGLILGPVLGLIDLTAAFGAHHATGVSGAIALMSELGIALLLFLVGLELSLDRIKDVGKVAAIAGIGQVTVTGAIGFGLVLLFGFSTTEAAMLATALTFSSTVVVVKLVGQKKDTDSEYGRIAVGVLLVQDVVVIIALTFVAGLGGQSEASGGEMALDVAKAFGGMALMIVGSLVASRFILPRPFEWAARRAEMLLMWSLALCFGYVVIAQSLGLSPEIGAFLAGMSLAQLHVAHDLTRRLQSLMNFFIAIFFVTLGAQMQLSEAGNQVLPALALAAFVMVIKPILLIVIITRLGYSQETAFKSGLTLAQISEFSFILAAVGMSAGLIGEDILAVIAIVGLTTIVISSYLIIHLDRLYDLVDRTGVLGMLGAPVEADAAEEKVKDHIIVVGMNTLGRAIVRGLADRGFDVVAIDTDPVKLRDLPGRAIIGNVGYIQVLEEAEFDRAQLIVSALQIEDTNNLLAYYARQAEVPCAIHGFDVTVMDDLRALDVAYVIDSKDVGMTRLIERVRSLEPLR